MTVTIDTSPRLGGACGRSPTLWAGATTAAPGLLAFIGEIGAAETHAHAAVQVLVLTAGQVTLRDRGGNNQVVSAAIIPPGVRHELRAAPRARGLLAYLDPSSRAGRAAAARVNASGDPAAASTWQAAAETLARTFPPGELVTWPDLGHLLVTSGAPGPGAPGGSAPRVEPPAALERAVALIPQLIGGPLLLEELAARVGLSASRLGHLFAEHLHLPYPAWRRWARLLHAVEAVRRGASLTTAAHAAGFADSAHLTRSCRAMFGITPSQALAAIGRPATGRTEMSGR